MKARLAGGRLAEISTCRGLLLGLAPAPARPAGARSGAPGGLALACPRSAIYVLGYLRNVDEDGVRMTNSV
jgi:hypothetical protein